MILMNHSENQQQIHIHCIVSHDYNMRRRINGNIMQISKQLRKIGGWQKERFKLNRKTLFQFDETIGLWIDEVALNGNDGR